MSSHTEAIFYDGKTSTKHTISIYIDSVFKRLIIKNYENKELYWNFSDISYYIQSDFLILEFGKETIQTIKISDSVFIENNLQYLKKNNTDTVLERIYKKGMTMYICIAFFILGVITVTYLYAIPWVGEKSANLIPESFDDYVSASFTKDFIEYEIIDTIKSNIVQEFADSLQLSNTKPLHFYVIESDMVNAFALPDGTIIIFSGIIDKMEDYSELAGLIAHETAHINNRHSIKMLCRNLSGYIFISAVLSDVNGIMAIIGDNIHNLQYLSYSRKFENEADTEGLSILISNNINPQGMTNLFKRLQSNSEFEIPEIISTHPHTNDRIEYISDIISNISFSIKENNHLKQLFNSLIKK